MTSNDSGKIALDEYEQFKIICDFLSSIQVVNWLNTGIPPLLQGELMRLKEAVEAKGGALPLLLQEMLIPEDLGEVNIGVDLVKGKQHTTQKIMLPDWDSYRIDSTNNRSVGDRVIPSYGWITYCYPKLWKLILGARIGSFNFGTVHNYWQQSEKFKELRGAIFSDSFIKYAVSWWRNDYLEILESNTYQYPSGEEVKYFLGEHQNLGNIKFKGASDYPKNWIGTSRQLDRKDRDYTNWFGRFTDLPGVGKPKVEKWVELGLTGFIDLMAIMDGDVNNYKNLMILPGVGSEESCKKMIISQQFGEWNRREYKKPEYYMEEV